jgi:hypothetical protein
MSDHHSPIVVKIIKKISHYNLSTHRKQIGMRLAKKVIRKVGHLAMPLGELLVE